MPHLNLVAKVSELPNGQFVVSLLPRFPEMTLYLSVAGASTDVSQLETMKICVYPRPGKQEIVFCYYKRHKDTPMMHCVVINWKGGKPYADLSDESVLPIPGVQPLPYDGVCVDTPKGHRFVAGYKDQDSVSSYAGNYARLVNQKAFCRYLLGEISEDDLLKDAECASAMYTKNTKAPPRIIPENKTVVMQCAEWIQCLIRTKSTFFKKMRKMFATIVG